MTSDQSQPEATSPASSRHGDRAPVDDASANPHQASWQASQIELLLQNVRAAGFSNVLAVGCLWWVAEPHMGPWGPALWCLPLPLISLMYMAHGYYWVHYRREVLGEPGFIRRLLVYPILQAVTWGWMCLGLYPNLDVEGQFLVTLTVAAVMPIGAVASSALREAGLAWVVTLTPFLFYTLLQGKYLYAVFIGPAVLVTALVSGVAVISISRDVRKRLMAETEAVEGREALSVLLRDIESQSDDWVWGIDAQRCLVHAPRAIEQLVALTRRFNEGKSFRNLEFSVAPRQSGDTARLWMISGVPLNQGEKGIGGWRGVIRDVTVLRRQEEELHRLAHIDALTGLTNRHFLVERCARVLEGRSKGGQVKDLDLIGMASQPGLDHLVMVDLQIVQSQEHLVVGGVPDQPLCEVDQDVGVHRAFERIPAHRAPIGHRRHHRQAMAPFRHPDLQGLARQRSKTATCVVSAQPSLVTPVNRGALRPFAFHENAVRMAKHPSSSNVTDQECGWG